MVAGVPAVERGDRDAAVLHAEWLRIEELEAAAVMALASRQSVARAEAAHQQVECELKVSKAELALKTEEKGRVAEELTAVREVLKTKEAGLEASRAETNRAKFVLSELNMQAHATVQALVRAFASIRDSAIGEKLNCVEKARGFVTNATSAYGTWCSWATTCMPSLLRDKGCSHIGPSARTEPSVVTALSGAGSGLNSSRRDVDDFTSKVLPALGH
uniref:Uncharacterized protein n=1 Tax=Oryza punctata TaxID=4537 RepID=A0A0E0LZC3_ORYPU